MKRAIVMASILAGVASPALAQGAPAANADADGQGDSSVANVGVQDIIVTAQRRAESIQRVPISIAAVNSAQLVTAGVQTSLDLQKVVPSLSVQYGTGTFTPFLRGIGNPSAVIGNEASVAAYVDGVYISRLYADFLPIDYLERIEVLKGPQGTLFGRNSTGGLINYITRTPTIEPTLETSLSYESFRTVNARAYAAGGIAGLGALSVTASYRNQDKGWGRNVVTGNEIFRGRRGQLRGKFVSDFSETTKITLSAGYAYTSNSDPLSANAFPGTTVGNPPGYAPAIYQAVSRYDVRGNIDPHTKATSTDLMGRLDQDFGAVNFVSITGYRKSTISPRQDYDYTPINYFNASLRDRERNFSQEFQILSPDGGALSWIIGGYYAFIDSGYDPAIFSGAQFGGVEARIYGRQKVKSLAGFAQATIEVVPDLKVTLGGRYTRDRARVIGRTDIALPGGDVIVPGTEQTAADTFKKFTYRAAVDYQASSNVLVYASASRGFKSGVFGLLPPVYTAAQPETVDAYEIGFKSDLLDRKIRVNGALFWSEVSNPQVALIQNATVVTINAGKARSRGAELEVVANPIEGLSVRASGTYLDAKYLDFENAPYTSQNTLLVNGIVPGCTTPATGNTNPANGGNVNVCSGDASGNYLPRAAKFSANFALDYAIPVGEGKVTISPNLSYNSGFYWDSDNNNRQGRYVLVDASIAYSLPGDQMTVRLFGRNLTKNKYFIYASEQGGANGSTALPGAPRIFGVALDSRF